MNGIAGHNIELARSRRDTYLSGLSDRTRSLCLGALVVIWGLFTEKDSAVLALSIRSKQNLLGVALAVVMVLAFDILEFAFGYQANRQAAGEKVAPKLFDYERWKTMLLSGKLLVGIVALSGLCFVLGSALVTVPISAAPAIDAKLFFGEWCGGDSSSLQYICLIVGQHEDKIIVELSRQDQNELVPCTSLSGSNGMLSFACGRSRFKLKPLKRDWMEVDVVAENFHAQYQFRRFVH